MLLAAAAALAVVAGTVAPAAAEPHPAPAPAPSPAPGTSARAGGCTESPFTAGFDAALKARWPSRRIAAALYDSRTGCQYRYRSDLRITTASVLKAEIMAGILLRAQRAGRALTATERSRVAAMIRTSDDPSANALWSSLGGTAAMRSLEQELGLTDTVATSPWGLTSTSAADRNELLRQLLLGQWGPFSASTRSEARAFMLDVTPSQRWGLTAGVPSSWKVPLKNGFFPASCCGWRVNTSGVVERPGGGAYVATVLSDGWATEAQGIEAVEFVSRDLAAWALQSIGPHLSPARFAHQAYVDVLGRHPSFAEEQAVAAKVGPVPSRAGATLASLQADPAVDRTSGALLRLYLTALQAPPSPGTWSGRVSQLRAGQISLGTIADQLAASPAFTGGGALTTSAFVDRAYQQAFGRLPSGADRDFWVRRLDASGHRGELLVNLANTATAKWRTVQRVRVLTAYLTLLRQLPSAGSSADWEARLWAGAPVSDLTGALFGSAAYADRFR